MDTDKFVLHSNEKGYMMSDKLTPIPKEPHPIAASLRFPSALAGRGLGGGVPVLWAIRPT